MRINRRFILVVLILALAVPAAAQRKHDAVALGSGGPLLPEQAAYDVTFYDLELAVNPADSSISGILTMTALLVQRTSKIIMDLDSRLNISAITDDTGYPLDWTRREGQIDNPT